MPTACEPDFQMLSLGDTLDEKYALESVLGRGGMGAVYRARHIGLNAPRAIKVMHRELAENQEFLARFLNEAKLAEELRHPNIVTLYDLSSLPDGTPYIVWEYVEGETLAHALDSGGTFTPHDVVELISGVAEGLASAHERKIVHRDISPDNLMLTRDPQGLRRLKVLDFGMAKFVGSLTEPRSGSSALGVFLGKIGYSSPEQAGLFDDAEPLDGRTDVFSLAVVAYRMLVGRLPFRASSIHAFLFDLTTAPEERVRERFERDLSPHFRRAFARALRRNRTERTPSMEELKRDLEGARRDALGLASTASNAKANASWLRPLVSVALGASVLLAVLLPMGRTPPAAPPVASTFPPAVSLPSSSSSILEGNPRAQSLVAEPMEPAEVPASDEEPRPLSIPDGSHDGAAGQAPTPSPEPVALPSLVEPEEVPEEVTPASPPSYGSLSITSNVWVVVRLDDGPLDETPIFLRRIPAGPHLLQVTRQGSPSRALEVFVREGETTAVHLENELR
jgi:serine/threonine-protein kinase